jgi:hypothetical protein
MGRTRGRRRRSGEKDDLENMMLMVYNEEIGNRDGMVQADEDNAED